MSAIKDRYEVVAKQGNKIMDRFFGNDYGEAMDKLDDFEARYSHVYNVEFTDHQLYSGKFR